MKATTINRDHPTSLPY